MHACLHLFRPNQHRDVLSYLLDNDFSYEEIAASLVKIEKNESTRKIEVFDENLIIQEGLKKLVKSSKYERSVKLRNFAIERFTKDGKINCSCCNFNFEDFYGIEIGKGFIEIHHAKPVFKFEDEDLKKTLEEAIKNVVPVCSNCHRMIHKSWQEPLEIQYLKERIKEHGKFIQNA